MTQHLNYTITDAAKTAQQTLKDDKVSVALAAKVTKQLAQQDQRLDTLEKRVKDLAWENRRGGGFPWALVLLVGGIYAVYRVKPDLFDKVKGLLGQADPGTKGNLNRAGAAVKDAAQSVVHGNDPSSAVKAAGEEVKRTGEKTVDAAQDKFNDLKDNVHRKADDLTK